MEPITSLPAANTIDGVNDVFPIVTNNINTTQKISRNTFLGLASAPVGLTDTQTLTNKTITYPTISTPTISSPVLSGTVTGTYTLGGTPTFPSTVVTTTGTQTLTNKTLTSPTLTNASITSDSIAGYTTSNAGTLYGIAISGGQITGSSTVTNAALASGVSYSKFYNPYKFSVYRNSSYTIPSASNPCIFDTKTFDTGSNYNISTGLFTAPVTGYYSFFGCTPIYEASTGVAIGSTLIVNGSIVCQNVVVTTYNVAYQEGIPFIAPIQYLTSGTTVGLGCVAGGVTASVGSQNFYFSGYLVSAT